MNPELVRVFSGLDIHAKAAEAPARSYHVGAGGEAGDGGRSAGYSVQNEGAVGYRLIAGQR